MAAEIQPDSVRSRIGFPEWLAGAGGGFIGSVLMGVMMTYLMASSTLDVVIPTMYGITAPAPLAGWALHQFHGVVLGLLYVAFVQIPPFARKAHRLKSSLLLGSGYGILTTLLPVIVMPLWLSAVGFPQAPPFPNIGVPGTIMSILAHVVYALPVALTYAVVVSSTETTA
jgi:hypothetical protein